MENIVIVVVEKIMAILPHEINHDISQIVKLNGVRLKEQATGEPDLMKIARTSTGIEIVNEIA